jgi:hypothetical protein
MIKFFQTDTGRILVSIIWGLGLAAILRQACKGRNCIILKAPDPKYIEKQTWKYNNKCYKFQTKQIKCDKNKEIIDSI